MQAIQFHTGPDFYKGGYAELLCCPDWIIVRSHWVVTKRVERQDKPEVESHCPNTPMAMLQQNANLCPVNAFRIIVIVLLCNLCST